MSLVLEYPDKYRLWADLIQGNSDRVFIATERPDPIGGVVPVRLSLPGTSLNMDIEGTVVGRRGGSARFRSGVYVRIGDDQIEKCRRFLGLTQSPERYEQGRKAPRYRCELSLRFIEPGVEATGVVKNLSQTGVLLVSPVDLLIGQSVQAVLSLGDDASLAFQAEVSWARNDKRLVGLKVEHPDAEVVAHPECEQAVLRHADFIGSTKALLDRVLTSPKQKFIVVTEAGILHQMKKGAPHKTLIPAPPDNGCACNECPYMRLNTMEKLYLCMRDRTPELVLPPDLQEAARAPLQRMLEWS